jgi:hypothetical protein
VNDLRAAGGRQGPLFASFGVLHSPRTRPTPERVAHEDRDVFELYWSRQNGGARGGEKERCDSDGAGALTLEPDTGCTKFLKEGAVCQKDLAERSYQTKDAEAD